MGGEQMHIVGHGFIAKHLQPLSTAHPDVVALASGVSFPQNATASYERERALVERSIDECRKRGTKLVFFSSAAIYGGPNCRGREDEPATPPTEYGRHKLGLEHILRDAGVRHLSVRLGYVLGRHAPKHRLVPSLVRQIRSGHVTVYRSTHRDLIHADDMVRILDALLAADASQEVINIASGRCVLIDEIIDHLEHRLGTRAQRHFTDNGTTHCLSLARLRTRLPADCHLDFDPDYYKRVIDSYLRDTGRLSDDAASAAATAVTVPPRTIQEGAER